MKKLDILVTGVGGQGVVLASDIMSEAAMAGGYDVKKTDTLGMAQRGGAVVSNVRIARRVWSPLIREGDVDVLLAFEKLEAARWVNHLRVGAVAIVNRHALPPLSVNLGYERYPTDGEIAAILNQRADRVYYIDGTARATEMGNARALNTYMLGCVSVFLPLRLKDWRSVILEHVPSAAREVNLAAFEKGRREVRGVRL